MTRILPALRLVPKIKYGVPGIIRALKGYAEHHSPWGQRKVFSPQPPSFPLTYYVIPAQAGIQKGGMRQPCVYHRVYFEQHEDMTDHPRKQVGKWKRACQLRLIEERNPDLISGFPPARE
jgi:hypothetical protein